MRPLCPRCQLPLRACLCAWLRPTANRLPLLVLQHPQEAGHAKGSLRLLRLSLAACTVQVGDAFEPAALAGWLGTTGSSVLIYPDPPQPPDPSTQPKPAPARDALQATGAPPTVDATSTALPCPARLVLLDGTWRQARALLRQHRQLQQLPRWALPAPAPSRYAIRRAQQPAQRSTLEAACAALGVLEGRPAFYAPLLDAFSAWVATLQAQAQRPHTVIEPGMPTPALSAAAPAAES